MLNKRLGKKENNILDQSLLNTAVVQCRKERALKVKSLDVIAHFKLHREQSLQRLIYRYTKNASVNQSVKVFEKYLLKDYWNISGQISTKSRNLIDDFICWALKNFTNPEYKMKIKNMKSFVGEFLFSQI